MINWKILNQKSFEKMGTRWLLRLKGESGVYVVIYFQFDGQPYSAPSDLFEWILTHKLCNGIGNEQIDNPHINWANGIDQLYLKIVSHVEAPMGVYLQPTTSPLGSFGVEYDYELFFTKDTESIGDIQVKIYEIGCDKDSNKLLGTTLLKNYKEWSKKPYQFNQDYLKNESEPETKPESNGSMKENMS